MVDDGDVAGPQPLGQALGAPVESGNPHHARLTVTGARPPQGRKVHQNESARTACGGFLAAPRAQPESFAALATASSSSA